MAGILRRREAQQPENREMTRQTQGQEPFQWLSAWDPFRSFGMSDPFQRMREMLGMDPFGELAGGFPAMARGFMPNLEVRETKDSYVICADLPGLTEENLNVDVTGNRLTISGKREEEQRDEGDRYWAYERSFGSFTRSFVLPEGTQPEQIDARLNNGVLEVRIPKVKAEEAKRIPVKGSGAGQKQIQSQAQGPASGIRQQGQQGQGQQAQGHQGQGGSVPTSTGTTQTGTVGSTGQESSQGGAREKAA